MPFDFHKYQHCRLDEVIPSDEMQFAREAASEYGDGDTRRAFRILRSMSGVNTVGEYIAELGWEF